jgi:hypothetical protein
LADSQLPTEGVINFENLMKTGQELMQRFEKAVTAQMATQTWPPKNSTPSKRTIEPLFNVGEIQKVYVEQMGVLWTNTLLQGYLGTQEPVVVPDKRVKR